ncbi:methyl-accepting chemotaxis protein [Marinomonas sp. 2405UD68-3]|uniref:methyl-accepting chemotaxis protein n=1 Tax=Marinomonas sp. 2405UD68-3 TaxID=3391835 RepID=UPI0039C9826D
MNNQSPSTSSNDLFVYWMLMAQAPVLFASGLIGDALFFFSSIAAATTVILTQVCYSAFKNTSTFSLTAAFIMMLTSAFLIQSQTGMIEMHFHIFVTMVVFLIYQRWQPLVVSLLTITLHHVVFMILQNNHVSIGSMPITLFPTADHSMGVMILHAVFALMETAILIFMARQMLKDSSTNKKIADAIEKISADNNLSIRLDNPQSSIELSFNQFLTQLSELFKDYQSIAVKLTECSQIVSHIGEQANTKAQERLISSQHMADSAKNITQKMQAVTESVNHSSREAHDVETSTIEDSQQALRVMQDMELLEQDTTSISKSLNELTLDVASITNLLQSIRGISEQTNLLALNAAIEAARAGETGRGFAVVADEVRTLAQRSSQSTDEIEEVLERLNSSAKKTVASMESGKKRTSENVINAKAISEGLIQRSQQVSQVAQTSQDVSKETQEQEVALSSIYEELSENASTTQKMAETMEKLANTSKDILLVTEEYQKKSSIFKL